MGALAVAHLTREGHKPRFGWHDSNVLVAVVHRYRLEGPYIVGGEPIKSIGQRGMDVSSVSLCVSHCGDRLCIPPHKMAGE